MGGCCGKENQLDDGQQRRSYTEQENANVSSKGVPRANLVSEQDGSAKFFNRNIPNTDSIFKALPLDSSTGITHAHSQLQAEIVGLKENKEEDKGNRAEKSHVPTRIIADIQVNRISSKERKEEDTWRKVEESNILQISANKDIDDLKVNKISLEEDERRQKERSSILMQIKPNKKIVQDIVKTVSIIPPTIIDANKIYSLETVEPYSKKGSYVMSKLTNRKFRQLYRINKIEQINNPYLLAQYELRKAKTQTTEQILYHGTQMMYLESICTYNFDWRVVRNCKFGFGVSFANNPYYASHYSTRGHCWADEDYIMILAKVLIGRTCQGKPNLKCPPESFDTTTNSDGQVLVKYDDCTFYPEFVIYFEEH